MEGVPGAKCAGCGRLAPMRSGFSIEGSLVRSAEGFEGRTTGTMGVPTEGLGVEVGYFSFVFFSHRGVGHYGRLFLFSSVVTSVPFFALWWSSLLPLCPI